MRGFFRPCTLSPDRPAEIALVGAGKRATGRARGTARQGTADRIADQRAGNAADAGADRAPLIARSSGLIPRPAGARAVAVKTIAMPNRVVMNFL
jgi:hypothetical protein